jgi:exo-beta-1,3-glucanase (GH17 family)
LQFLSLSFLFFRCRLQSQVCRNEPLTLCYATRADRLPGAYGHKARQQRAQRAPILRKDVTHTAYSEPTEQAQVVVYVNDSGEPISTVTETVIKAPATSVEDGPTAAEPTDVVPTTATSVVKSTPSSDSNSTKAATEPASSAAIGGGNLHGITYSPYKGSGGCKSSAEVEADFDLFARDHGVIRLYGVDCDQVASAYTAAKKYGNKLMLGIFDIDAVEQAVSAMDAGVEDWDIVDTVSVGNEHVNNGEASVDQALDALSRARSGLRAVGYEGPVVIVDTFVAAMAHPELCEESDYCAVNVHPFFDPNTSPSDAGSFVSSTVKQLSSKLSSDKRIRVTETGWPWQGETNGAATPGMEHQAKALSSIEDAYSNNPDDVFFFTAFNDLWKKAEAGTFMAEQYWGMGGRYSPSDE